MSHTIVLWHGQYRHDGNERLRNLNGGSGLSGLRNPRLTGDAGDWYLIADADAYEPNHTEAPHGHPNSP